MLHAGGGEGDGSGDKEGLIVVCRGSWCSLGGGDGVCRPRGLGSCVLVWGVQKALPLGGAEGLWLVLSLHGGVWGGGQVGERGDSRKSHHGSLDP